MIRNTILLALLACTLNSAAEEDKFEKRFKAPNLEAALLLLNRVESHPPVVSNLYSAAYALLADPNASFANLVDDAPFQKLCAEHGIIHLGGPMLGAVTSDGVRVWVRTTKPAAVTVRVKVGAEEKRFGPISSTVASDLVAVVPVTGLQAGTSYPYTLQIDGKPLVMPIDAAITTAPSPDTASKVRIAFGSCYHRSGIGNTTQANLIRTRNPAALLLLGDIAVQDRQNHLGMHRADYLLRDIQQPWQRLVASIPVYATWDDHDYFSNDASGIPKRYTDKDTQNVCDVFKASWNNPSYGFDDERRGIFTRTRIGPCDIIMVDNRYFRNRDPGSFLGKGQLAWLKQSLLDCKGPFIIMSCGSMWSDYVSRGKDSWGSTSQAEREEIFSLIETNRIGGVLLISGDRHGARGFSIPRPSGFEFYEFEAASLGARSGPAKTNDAWTTQLYGIANEYAFGEFSIDATLADPEVTFRLMREDGHEIYTLTLTRSQLTPGEATASE